MAKSLLYTATGDKGMTSLVGGERIAKNSERLEAYGTIDELSSALGVVAADPECIEEIKGQIMEIQNELFNIGCYLATQPAENDEPKLKDLTQEKIATLEGWIDALDAQTPKIRAFVLPGGSKLAAETHLARTICRRAERRILDLTTISYVDNNLIKYINRLSDYLFICARYFNFRLGIDEIVWRQ